MSKPKIIVITIIAIILLTLVLALTYLVPPPAAPTPVTDTQIGYPAQPESIPVVGSP